MPRIPDPKIEWDTELGAFRAREQPIGAPRIDPRAPWNRRLRQATATVSSLLGDAFGRRLSSGATGLQVPAHLRPYVQPKAKGAERE